MMILRAPSWASCCLFLFAVLVLPASAHGRRLLMASAPLQSPTSAPPGVENKHIDPSIAGQSTELSPLPPPPLAMLNVLEKHHHYHKELIVAIILISVAVVMVLLSAVFAFFLLRRSNKNSDMECFQNADNANGRTLANSLKVGRRGVISKIEYPLLETATDNFSKSNILGTGAFGYVYRANIAGSVPAAVKKVGCSGQDAEGVFENELDLLGRIQHPNIVSLLCYCIRDKGRYNVYELMENGSLERQLHGPTHGSSLSWQIRMKIAVDIARGLEYLHEHCNPPVIHRNLKSSKILLNSDFNAKIADFSLAIAVGNNKGSLEIARTLGYVAPEYLLDGKLTEKSDVYAFGVILLELLTGKQPLETTTASQLQSIVTWAMPQLSDRTKLPTIIDPVIKDTMDLKHLYQVAAVAVLCVQPEPSYRPLITDVLHSLIPLVPVELGGARRSVAQSPCSNQRFKNP